MTSQINSIVTQPAPVICDFGWYYGTISAPSRLPEFSFKINSITYPPGVTTLANSATFPNTIVVASTASFESSGTLEVYAGNLSTQRTTTPYSVVDLTHMSCTGGSGTFAAGTPVFDPRWYVDSIPVNVNVIFDAVDTNNMGIPAIQVPAGISIVSYRWNFGNGSTASGPYAQTIYDYGTSVPGLVVTLTATDTLNRSWSCAHRIDIQNLIGLTGTSLIERHSTLGYR